VQTATNPQTGERVQWNGSAWVPLDAGAAPTPQPAPMAAPQGGITLGTPRPPKPERPTPIPGYPGYFMGPDGRPFKPEGLPEQPAAAGPAKVTAKVREEAIAGYTSAQALRRIVADLRQKYAAGPGSTSGIAGAQDFLPTEANRNFDSAANAARGIVGQALGFTGGQLNTAAEAAQAVGPYLPDASNYDGTIEDKIARLEALAGDAEQRSIAILGGRPDANGIVTPVEAQQAPDGVVAPETAPQAPQGPSEPVYDANLGGQQLAVSTNGSQTVDNPELAGVRGEYLSRLGAGQGAGEIIPWLRQAGVTDPKLLRSVIQQIQFRKANPNVPIDKYNTNVLDDMDVPLSGIETAMNDAAQSTGGAYLMNAGNAVTANNLDSIVGLTGGNEERARLALDHAQDNSPVASMAGNISGGVLAALGAEGALAARGMGAGLGRALTADAGYGMAAGAGAADGGDRVMGAVRGGLSGLVGSGVGQGVAKGVGAAISPTGGRLADLYEQGVRPTPGQRFANSGIAGRAINATEEALQSVPVVGSAIQGARQGARDQWQVAAWNSALGEIGEKLPGKMKPGTGAHQFAQQKFNQVYDKAREGMIVAADEQLASEVGQLGEGIANLAEPSIRRFENIVRNTVLRRAGDVIDGASYKKIQSELGKTIRGIRKSPSGDGELADALEELSGIIDSAARRHSDPQAVALLDAADKGYAKFVQIEQASGRGGVGKEAGTFSPNDFAGAVKGNGQRVRSKAYNQGEGLMQDFAEQGQQLSDRMGNSFTTDRALVVGGTGAAAAGYMEPSTLGVLGVIGALYSPAMRKGLTGAMAPRGPKAKAVADQVRKRGRIAGAAGAAALTQTSGGQ
jgi:hypothetical protein